MRLLIESLTFRYAAAAADPIFRDLHVDVGAVRKVALMGPSGSGKSTLLKLMAGVLVPDAGHIRFAHVDSADEPAGPTIGYVSQEEAQLPWLTVTGSICLTRSLVSGGQRSDILPEDGEMLESLGLAAYRDALPFQLSGGMKRRAALAACLLSHAELYVLDEPFSGSDLSRRKAMYQVINAATESRGAGLVFTTHDPVDAVELADMVLWIGNAGASELVVLDASAGWSDELRIGLSDLLLGGGR